MLYIIDSAHIELIKKCAEFYPIDGVTTNPTIISKEKTDVPTSVFFFSQPLTVAFFQTAMRGFGYLF